MTINAQEIEAIAGKAWPHVASVSVQPIVSGRRRANEFDPLDSGFTLTAFDAGGDIVKRFSAETLDTLKGKIEEQVRKQDKAK
jgi:hypothetical protein